MLSYLLSGAVALVVGASGGFLGGRLAVSTLRRDHTAALRSFDAVDDQIHLALKERPTRDELGAVFQNQQQTMAQLFVTREELKPVFKEVITRPELDAALQAVVIGISRNAGLPLPTPQAMGETAALAGASGDELARVIAGLSQQMGQINQQLGLG